MVTHFQMFFKHYFTKGPIVVPSMSSSDFIWPELPQKSLCFVTSVQSDVLQSGRLALTVLYTTKASVKWIQSSSFWIIVKSLQTEQFVFL